MEHEIALALPFESHDVFRGWIHYLPHTTFDRSTQLLNAYFDTPNQDLKRQKAALRLRFDAEQACWIQTLKTAGKMVDGVHVRQEWEHVLPNAEAEPNLLPALDLSLFANDAQVVLSPFFNDLRVIFHTNFTREIYQYVCGADSFEFAFDFGEVRLANEHSNEYTVINELEIEYKSGDMDNMRHLATYTQGELNAAPQTMSKAARGYALLS